MISLKRRSGTLRWMICWTNLPSFANVKSLQTISWSSCGGSTFKGFTALAAAAASGDLVTAVVAEGAPGDLYRGYPRERGGAVLSNTLWWFYYMDYGKWPSDPKLSSLFTNHQPLNTMDEVLLGYDVPFWNEMLAAYESSDAAFWKNVSLAWRYQKICMPVLHIKALEEMWTGPIDNYEGIKHRGCSGVGNPDQWFIYGTAYHGGLIVDYEPEYSKPAYQLLDNFLAKYLTFIFHSCT